MICIEILEDGQRRKLEHELWITGSRNGAIVTPHRALAKGVSDGKHIWSLGALEGYPAARIITLAEYEESRTTEETDPELSAEEALSIILGGET